MNIRKNISLLLGISIPILMILFVAGSIYIPGLFVKPQYNFLYVSGDNYYSGPQYSIQHNKLIKSEVKEPDYTTYGPPRGEIRLLIHDVVKNESREITPEEAQNLFIDSNNTSPDGFEVVHGSYGDGFFPFFFMSEGNYNTQYLKGHNVSKKLNLQLNGHYYDNFRFLGWTK
jgi:hypothetical protein